MLRSKLPIPLPIVLASVLALSCGDDPVARLRASIEVIPPELDFGSAALGSTKELELRIKNKGSLRLELHNFAAEAPFIPPAGTATLGTGFETKLKVAFRPTMLGKRDGKLSFATVSENITIDVPLTGTGIEAAVKVDPTTIDFGEVLFATAAPPVKRMVTVSNPGTDRFELTSLALSEDGGGAFTLDPKSAKKTYGPGESATFEISYAPKAMGAVRGAVKITTTTRAAPEITVRLDGKGVGPKLDLCANVAGEPEVCSDTGGMPRINFVVERTAMGQGKMRVKNTGDRDLILGSILLNGPPAEFRFSPDLASTRDVTIAPGRDTRFDVTFTPADFAFDAVVVSFVTNAAVRGATSVRVEGRVKRPEINVSPRGLTFSHMGAVPRGESPVGIRSCGLVPLVVRSVRIQQLAGPVQGAFKLQNVPAANTSLAPGRCPDDPAGATFQVVFETMTTGNYRAEVTIESNDPIDPTVMVTVEATKS